MEAISHEAAFDAAIGEVLGAKQVLYRDFSTAVVDNQYFYDTDHLNRDGVNAFMDAGLVAALREHLK